MGRAGGKDRGPGPVRRFYHRHGTDSFKAAAHVSSNLEEFATVILKPATVTPLSALMLSEALFQSGLPPSVLQVLTGYGKVIGDPLVKDERVRMISFTGGIEAGKRISQLAGIKKDRDGAGIGFPCDSLGRCRHRVGCGILCFGSLLGGRAKLHRLRSDPIGVYRYSFTQKSKFCNKKGAD